MAKQEKTLAAFMRERQRAECPVCQLPDEIREQLGPAASKRGFTRNDQLAWLHQAVGAADVTAEALTRHYSARHDQEVS